MLKTSPIARFPGTITLPDYMTLPQVLAFEEMGDAVKELRQSAGSEGVSRAKLNALQLPALLQIVTLWQIDGVESHPTIDNFPMTPRMATAELIAWAIDEVTRLYVGEIEIPNG